MRNYYGLFRGHKRPWKFLAARLLMLSGLCNNLVIRQLDHKLHFHRSNAAMSLWIDPHERDRELEFFRAYLSKGDFVVDVGANIGETAITASRIVGDNGRIVAFEPHPRTYDFLKENLALNDIKNVTALNVGLGDVPGTVGFTDDRREDMNHVTDKRGSISVELKRLDCILDGTSTINLLKIDVEGFEKFVLLGAAGLVSRIEGILFEASEDNCAAFHYTVRELLSLLSAYGFQIYRIVAPGRVSGVALDTKILGFENLIAMRSADDVRRRTGWFVQS